MDKRFLAILAVVIIGIFGVFLLTREDTATSPGANTTASVSNHVKGNTTSTVQLVEYADFQCPACASFYSIVKEVTEKYQDRVGFTFRHFPLDNIHQNARAAHRAAEAAGNQGKFFEMHDLLFENQPLWSQSSNPVELFNGYASQLELNIDTFKADFLKEVTNDIINADINDGQSKGVNSTPTFFLNGTRLENGDISTVEAFSAKIEEALAN